MSTKSRWALVVGCAALAASANAGPLDRLKSKLDDARSEVQDARNDIDTAARADERIEAAADRAAPSPAQIESRAAGEVERTEAVRALRAAEQRATAVATADERAQAAVASEVGGAQREAEAAFDVESQARRELEGTEAAGAVRQAERDVDAVLTADERAERELESRRANFERALKLE